MKKMILVTSPPASGKTYISIALAKKLKHVVYLDKDSLIVLSKQIFAVANQEYNRSSDFFEKNIRNFEYEAIVALGLDALNYDDIVLISAPFTREIRSPKYMDELREKLAKQNAHLYIVWVVTKPEVVHQRMVERNSDRDSWKLANWEEYSKGINYTIPDTIEDKHGKHSLLLFYNSDEAEFDASMKKIIPELESKSCLNINW